MSKDELSFISKGNEYKDEIKSMVIIASHKIGKTSNLARLPNSLNIDVEGKAGYFPGNHVNIKKIAKEKGVSPYKVLEAVADRLKKSDKKYDYIIIDTLTVLSDIAKELATENYQKTPAGQDFDPEIDDLFTLAHGAGYHYHRKAMLDLIEMFDFAEKCLIMTAHTKDGVNYTPQGEVNAADINLVGQLRTIIPSRVDAIGTMYVDPDDENKRILSFRKHAKDIVTGTLISHLSGKEFVISEKKDEDTLVTHWDKIFID